MSWTVLELVASALRFMISPHFWLSFQRQKGEGLLTCHLLHSELDAPVKSIPKMKREIKLR